MLFSERLRWAAKGCACENARQQVFRVEEEKYPGPTRRRELAHAAKPACRSGKGALPSQTPRPGARPQRRRADRTLWRPGGNRPLRSKSEGAANGGVRPEKGASHSEVFLCARFWGLKTLALPPARLSKALVFSHVQFSRQTHVRRLCQARHHPGKFQASPDR